MRSTDAGGGMPKTRAHRRKHDDPLVSINGARVRVAIEWKGLSVNRAARRMKVSQQTLDSIVRGQTKRCYQSLREKLATLVGLPAAWLGGETTLLPTFAPWRPPPGLGYKPPFWVDENLRRVFPPEGGDLTQRETLAPRYELAAHDLSSRIAEAWKRDIERDNPEAKVALSRLAKAEWKDRPWDRVMMLVARLLSAFWWRRLLLKPPTLPAAIDPKAFGDAEWLALGQKGKAEIQRRAAEQLAADEEFAAACATALTTALRPWLTDHQELDYKTFVDVLEWASGGFGKNPSPGGT